MRRPNVIRPVRLHTTLPEDIRAKLDLHLYSELEGCIPTGAYQRFFLDRIREFFATEQLDLGLYIPSKHGMTVRGSSETISYLRFILGGLLNDSP